MKSSERDSRGTLFFQETRGIGRIMGYAVIRQRFQENFTIGHALDAGVEQREDAAVGLGADEAAEALFQRQNRLRHLKFSEGIAPVILQRANASGHDGIARN